MSWYQWTTELDIHVPEMNDEHKVIIDLMNQLHDLHEKKATKAQLAVTLGELVRFTKKHFQDEERYMESIQFTDFETHKIIHTRLIKQLEEHKAEFDAGPGALSDKFFDFLKMWLNAHIKGIDRKYGDFSQQRRSA